MLDVVWLFCQTIGGELLWRFDNGLLVTKQFAESGSRQTSGQYVNLIVSFSALWGRGARKGRMMPLRRRRICLQDLRRPREEQLEARRLQGRNVWDRDREMVAGSAGIAIALESVTFT